ncbi:MAG: RNA 3'-terminal phosphate cyclase [candidate division WOR-3 bacterium]|nr:RNA 3'-terminal phosphate cyclase [candidate division WOR-3 bacterium]
MLRIDGSYGEGGGQILRTALSLSAILKIPFEIYNIRKGRKKPGLLAQHLTSVNAVSKICNAEVTGNTFGSTRLTFVPKDIIPGEYEFNVAAERGSAGAVTLVAQSLIPILLATKSRLVIKGGTHVPFSPPFDYLAEILLPFLRRYGYNIEAKISQYGFFPVGRGSITIEFRPSSNIKTITTISERGKLKKLTLISRAANLPLSIAERQSAHFLKLLKVDFPQIEIEQITETIKAACPGTYLFLKAEYENIIAGFSNLGAKGKPAETVAEEVYQEYKSYLLSEHGVFDFHLADQICIFLAKQNVSNITINTNKITEHLKTNIWTIQQFLPNFKPWIPPV